MTSKKITKSNTLQPPPRHYYRLDQAAAYLSKNFSMEGIDADYLLHLAATNRLQICTLANRWFVLKKPRNFWVDIDDRQDVSRADFAFSMWVGADFAPHPDLRPCVGPVILHANDVQLLEIAGQVQIWVCFPPKYDGDNAYFIANKAGSSFCSVEEMPLVKLDSLFVFHDELEKLAHGITPQPLAVPERSVMKIHGNAVRYSSDREAVLRAAIACKEQFADACVNAEKWAECIDEKGRLFWPSTGEPPLARSSIVDMLREAVALPD